MNLRGNQSSTTGGATGASRGLPAAKPIDAKPKLNGPSSVSAHGQSTVTAAAKPKLNGPSSAALQSQLGISRTQADPSCRIQFLCKPETALKTEITALIDGKADHSALQRPQEGMNNLTLYTPTHVLKVENSAIHDPDRSDVETRTAHDRSHQMMELEVVSNHIYQALGQLAPDAALIKMATVPGMERLAPGYAGTPEMVVMPKVQGQNLKEIILNPELRHQLTEHSDAFFRSVGRLAATDVVVHNTDRFFLLFESPTDDGSSEELYLSKHCNLGNTMITVDNGKLGQMVAIDNQSLMFNNDRDAISRPNQRGFIQLCFRNPDQLAQAILDGLKTTVESDTKVPLAAVFPGLGDDMIIAVIQSGLMEKAGELATVLPTQVMNIPATPGSRSEQCLKQVVDNLNVLKTLLGAKK